MVDNKVKKALTFAKKLVGIKYKWWTPQTNMLEDGAPQWSVNKKNKELNKIDGTNCAGFINLIRRHLKLTIPGTEIKNYKYPGGTYIWFKTLYKKGLLEEFNPKKSYPAGTLLLRNFKNNYDQGHVAVIYKENKDNVFLSKIIHSFSDTEYNPKSTYSLPGVTIEPLGRIFFFFKIDKNNKGYMTHICYPKYWLSELI